MNKICNSEWSLPIPSKIPENWGDLRIGLKGLPLEQSLLFDFVSQPDPLLLMLGVLFSVVCYRKFPTRNDVNK